MTSNILFTVFILVGVVLALTVLAPLVWIGEQIKRAADAIERLEDERD